jgi:hypothetical protein
MLKNQRKMKKSAYKSGLLTLLALLIVPFCLKAAEVTKEYHKEYSAGPNTTLDIDNKYGDVVIESWDKDQITIDVKVTVELPNQDKAQKLLDLIDVQFSDSKDLVTAKTVIDSKFSFTGWGGESKKFSINYNVKMPAASALTLSNKYGDTDIDQLNGIVNLDIKYGNLDAGKLLRENEKPLSSINLAYGKADIDEAGWVDLTVRYSGEFSIEKCQALLLDSKYSKLNIGEISSIVGNSKYDNLRIDKINNLVLDNGYCDVKIGELTKKLKYSGSYGSFEVETIPPGFEELNTDTRYIGVKLGINESANYELNARLSYGGLKYDEDNFRSQRRIVESNRSEISGVIGGDENPESKVNVSSSYGSVRLY